MVTNLCCSIIQYRMVRRHYESLEQSTKAGSWRWALSCSQNGGNHLGRRAGRLTTEGVRLLILCLTLARIKIFSPSTVFNLLQMFALFKSKAPCKWLFPCLVIVSCSPLDFYITEITILSDSQNGNHLRLALFGSKQLNIAGGMLHV